MILQRVLFFLPLVLTLNFCHAAIDAQSEQDKPEVDSFLPSLMQSARFMRIQPVASQEQEQSVSGQNQVQTQQPFDYYDAARAEDQQLQAQQQRDASPEFSNPEFIPRAVIIRPASGYYGRISRYLPPTYQNGPISQIQPQVFLVDGGVPSYEDTPNQSGQFATASSENPGELPPIVRPAVDPVVPRPQVEDPKEASKQVEAKVQDTTQDPIAQTEKADESSTPSSKDSTESESVDLNQSTETPIVETEAPKSEDTTIQDPESTTQEPMAVTEEESKVVDSEIGEKSEDAEKTVTEGTENSETTATEAPKEVEKAETEEAKVVTDATGAPKEAETEVIQTENKETDESNPTTAFPEDFVTPKKTLEEITAGVENKQEEAQDATEAPKEAETEEAQTEKKETEEPNPTTAQPETFRAKRLEEAEGTTVAAANKPEEEVQQDESTSAAPGDQIIDETTAAASIGEP